MILFIGNDASAMDIECASQVTITNEETQSSQTIKSKRIRKN